MVLLVNGDKGEKGEVGPYNSFDMTIDTFTGDGSNTIFSLSTTPVNANHTLVIVSTVVQERTAYSLTGANLTFTAAPSNGEIIEVTTFAGGAKGQKGESGLTTGKAIAMAIVFGG